MTKERKTLIIGGSAGIGRVLAEHTAATGRHVALTSRDLQRADLVADEIDGNVTAHSVDLSDPHGIASALADIDRVDELALVAVERDYNTVQDYDIDRAIRLTTIKLVGYTAVVNALQDRFTPESSIVIFGGLAKERPYPGSTTISTINDAMTGLVRTLTRELAPVRVNGLHPGVAGDHPEWASKPPEVLANLVQRTPLGRLVTMAEVAQAALFLFDHPSINGTNLYVDGGWMIT